MNNENKEIKDLKEKILELERTIHYLKKDNSKLLSKLETKGKYEIREYKYKNEEYINPYYYNPSDIEIENARSYHFFENCFYSIFTDITDYVDLLHIENNHEKANSIDEKHKQHLLKYKDKIIKGYEYQITSFNKALSDNEHEITFLDYYVSKEWFNDIVSGLRSYHVGDCTAVACTCDRCFAESCFRIPYTANKSKHESHQLLTEFLESIKENKGE